MSYYNILIKKHVFYYQVQNFRCYYRIYKELPKTLKTKIVLLKEIIQLINIIFYLYIQYLRNKK
jgi:hypothetical protein